MQRCLWGTMALIFGATLVACEDGPEQIFQPNQGNIPQQNGFGDGPSFTQPGQTDWTTDRLPALVSSTGMRVLASELDNPQETMMADVKTYHGNCFCGAVELSISGEPAGMGSAR